MKFIIVLTNWYCLRICNITLMWDFPLPWGLWEWNNVVAHKVKAKSHCPATKKFLHSRQLEILNFLPWIFAKLSLENFMLEMNVTCDSLFRFYFQFFILIVLIIFVLVNYVNLPWGLRNCHKPLPMFKWLLAPYTIIFLSPSYNLSNKVIIIWGYFGWEFNLKKKKYFN